MDVGSVTLSLPLPDPPKADVAVLLLAHLGQIARGISNDQLVVILIIAAVSGLMLITTRRKLRRAQNTPKAYAREQVSRLKDERAVARGIEELMVQLEQVTRQMNARLDTKFAKLEAVVRDADGRADRLERLLRKVEGRPTLDVIVDDRPTDPLDSQPAEQDPQRQAIFKLDQAGLTAPQIAQEVGQAVGEVELILALQKASESGAY